MTRSWFLAAVALASCAPAPAPAPVREPRPATPADDEEVVVAREAAIAKPDAATADADADSQAVAEIADDRRPRISPWTALREHDQKTLAPDPPSCDTRPPPSSRGNCAEHHGIRLAARVISEEFIDNGKLVLVTVDGGRSAGLTTDFFLSLLDDDYRPATRWVHPIRVDNRTSMFEVRYDPKLFTEGRLVRAAIVEYLTSDTRFPAGDPRSAP